MIAPVVAALVAQTFTRWELIMVDDCSTDDSYGVLRSLTDPRIRVYKNDTNSGPYASLNAAYRFSTGELIAINDSDDISYPERLAMQVRAFEDNVHLGMCAAAFDLMDERGNITAHMHQRFYNEQMVLTLPAFNIVAHSSVMYRRGVFEACGLYEERGYCNDWRLWERISRYAPMHYVATPLVALAREHANIPPYTRVRLRVRCGIFHMPMCAAIAVLGRGGCIGWFLRLCT